MADEAKSSGEIDDWLADLDEEAGDAGAAAAGGELDQSDIDALLGGTPPPAAAGTPASAEDAALELDQSDIDSLFGDLDAPAPEPVPAAPAEFGEDLSQSGIDELLGGEAAPAATPAAETREIDQSDIDSLFASPSPAKESPLAEGEEAPSQEEMDELFGSIGLGAAAEDATVATSAPVAATGTGAADEPGAEAITFSDVLHETGSGSDAFALDDEAGFAADAFSFDDSIPDIPDESGELTEKKAPVAKAAEEDIFAETGSQQEDLTALLAAGEESIGTKGGGKPSATMSSSISKSTIGIAVIAMLALGGGAYYFMTRPKTVPPPPPLPAVEKAKPAATAPANHPPTVKDEEIKIDEASNTAAINLTAQDADNDKIQFEIVKPPEHGRLSGDLPNLTYLPNPDFPGEDTLEFLAADGKDASPPGRIHIVGPNLQEAVAKKEEGGKAVKPAAKPVVKAVDVALTTTSGQPLVIDWKKVWQKANRSAYGSKVQVEIVEAGLRGGELTSMGASRHRYQPQRYFSGTETIRYRFHKAGVASPTRQLLVRVVAGGIAPELVLKPLAPAYQIGETVVLDARATRSATPEALTFKWEQVAGTAVLLEPMNAQSSAVAFVMPSYFSRERAPQPVVQVTATDAFGRHASRTITVGMEPKRKSPSALWRGTPEGEVAPEPPLPMGEHPGRL